MELANKAGVSYSPDTFANDGAYIFAILDSLQNLENEAIAEMTKETQDWLTAAMDAYNEDKSFYPAFPDDPEQVEIRVDYSPPETAEETEATVAEHVDAALAHVDAEEAAATETASEAETEAETEESEDAKPDTESKSAKSGRRGRPKGGSKPKAPDDRPSSELSPEERKARAKEAIKKAVQIPEHWVITKVAPNPRRAGTEVYRQYEFLEVGITVGEVLARGLQRSHLHWEVNRGNVEVAEPS